MSPAQRKEAQRIASLRSLDILDTPTESVFDGLVEVAAAISGAPISLISLVDEDRQWFKANHGLDGVTETPRDIAFCSTTIDTNDILEIPDATIDPRFSNNPLVTGQPNIRFYAGHALRLSNGDKVGTLCVIDRVPGELSREQHDSLAHLANAATKALEARRTKAELASSEARFRTLCETLPLGIFSTDTNGAYNYTNPCWQEIFGMTATDRLDQGWMESVHPQDRPALFKRWRSAVETPAEFHHEFRTLSNDGSIRHARIRTLPVITDAGISVNQIGTVEDITRQVAEKSELQEQRNRLKSIIEGTGTGTWEWNCSTGEVRLNEHWAAMVGKTLDTTGLVADDCIALVHPDDLPHTKTMLRKHLKGETPHYEVEIRVRHSEGHWVWVIDRGRLFTFTECGKPEWIFGTRTDITERKMQHQALRRSEQLLNQTGSVANIGGWELDIASKDLRWSDQTCVIHGLQPGHKPNLESAIGFYAPEAQPAINEAVENAIETGSGWDLELPFIQANGNHIWVRAIGVVEVENHKPVRLIGTFQDITERRQQLQALENAHERITVATQSGKIGVWDWNSIDNKLTWSMEMYSLYGISKLAEPANYESWLSRVHPDDREVARQQLKHNPDTTDTNNSEYRVQWDDGSIHHLQSARHVRRDSNNNATGVLGVSWDVTQLRNMSNELAEQHELLRVTLQSIGDAVITTDAAGQVTWLNPVAEKMTGCMAENAIGNAIYDVFNIVDESTREPALNPIEACLNGDKTGRPANQNLLLSCNGEEFGIEDSASAIRSVNNEVLGAVLVFRDVTETRRLSVEMNYRATHDSLTNLKNRSEFESCLQRTLHKAHNTNSTSALMFIDLDQFKLVNDTCGHTVGDQLLQQVAELLAGCVRSTDTLARLGGDEFGVILEDCTGKQATRIAQKICRRVDDFRFAHGGQRLRIGTSIGLVSLDKRWDTTASVMQAADSSCYTAKEAGRNRVHVWYDTDEEMQSRRDEMQWATRLEQAIDENRFVLYAQRIAPLVTEQQGLHAEVLLRLLDEEGNIVPPAVFLPAAERFHLATRIDRWVLQHSIDQLVRIADIKTVNMLCINLSGQSVGDKVFHRDAIAMLTAAGENVCQSICLEITETVAITNITDATAFIAKVRELGVRVALDDFGAGASSFSYLKILDVDILKIDGQFITGMIDDTLDAAAVRCFVDVAATLGLKTVAEFVKSKEILDQVESIGIDYAQGYLLHKPERIEAVLHLQIH